MYVILGMWLTAPAQASNGVEAAMAESAMGVSCGFLSSRDPLSTLTVV